MAKKKVYTDGYRAPSYKTMNCLRCDAECRRVSYDATGVVCWKCTMQTLKKYETVIREGNTR